MNNKMKGNSNNKVITILNQNKINKLLMMQIQNTIKKNKKISTKMTYLMDLIIKQMLLKENLCMINNKSLIT